MTLHLLNHPVFNDYPNAKPIDRRRLKKLRGKVYTEEVLMVNPFDTTIAVFLANFISDDIVYIDRKIFNKKWWIYKSVTEKRDLTALTRTVKVHRLFDTERQVLVYKLREK